MDRTKAIDNVSVRPAPSGSTHAAGYFDDGTTVEAEWMNGVQEELCNAIVALGGTLDTDVYDTLGDRLTETVLTNGRFSTSLAVRPHPTIINKSDFRLYGLDLAECGIYSRGNQWMVCPAGGSPGVILYPYFIDVGADGIDSDGDISTDNDLIVKGKIKNAAAADVVFDDGVEVEGDLTVGGKLDLHVIDLGDLTCDWDTTGTHTEKSAVGVALTYDTAHAVAYFDLTINNTSGGVVDLNSGETIFCTVFNSNPGTIIGAFCKTTSATGASAATLMSLRMMATACEDGAGNPVIALVSSSAKAIPIPASDAGSVTVRCYLQYATLS